MLGMRHFVLISAPGSGKGTFSQYLVEKYQYRQICLGDIFRNEIRLQTELGKKIQPIVEGGGYVDEGITCTLVSDAIDSCLRDNIPFIIDGFPRSTFSFLFLYNTLRERNIVDNVCIVQFIASDELCQERISHRCVCTNCCKVYNAVFLQPQEDGLCDTCSTPLSLRMADTTAIVKDRLHYFHENTEKLIVLAQDMYQVIKINAEKNITDLHEEYDQMVITSQHS